MPKIRLRPYLLVIAAAVAAVFCLTPWGQGLDRVNYDGFFGLRGKQALSDDIVFVAIDETSFTEIGEQWPWSRALHARLLENIYKAGAKTVAMDILLPEVSTPEADAALARVLATYGTTILAADISRTEDSRFVVENNIQPLDIFVTPLTRTGHIRTPSDSDGFVRRADLEIRGIRALALEAALAYTDGRCCKTLPADELPLINYSGGPDSVRTISYYQALDPDRYLPADALKDKLVILGVNTTSSAMPEERRPDHFPIPFTRWGGGYAPGSIVHASVAANLLNDSFIRAAPLWTVAAAGFLLATIFGFATINIGFRNSTLIAVGVALLVGTACYQLFALNNIYVSPTAMLLPLLAAYLFSPYYRYLEEARQRAFIRKAFSSYVNPAIVAQLEKDPDSVKLGGKQVDGTALFLDIAGFTRLSEIHEPEVVIAFINVFLSQLIDIAMAAGGTVERFLGDAIMVIWGAPVAEPDHARLACNAAVQMAEAIQRVSATESERMGARVHARIGINSGSMTAGNIGANQRFNYTVLGDCVNLAARLEGLNKMYLTTAIVGNATASQLDSGFSLRYLDTVTVKGRAQPERIFELLGHDNHIGIEKAAAVAAYARGIGLYQQRQWQAARDAFTAGLNAMPDDGPCRVLQARCDAYLRAEPAITWTGVFDIDVK